MAVGMKRRGEEAMRLKAQNTTRKADACLSIAPASSTAFSLWPVEGTSLAPVDMRLVSGNHLDLDLDLDHELDFATPPTHTPSSSNKHNIVWHLRSNCLSLAIMQPCARRSHCPPMPFAPHSCPRTPRNAAITGEKQQGGKDDISLPWFQIQARPGEDPRGLRHGKGPSKKHPKNRR